VDKGERDSGCSDGRVVVVVAPLDLIITGKELLKCGSTRLKFPGTPFSDEPALPDACTLAKSPRNDSKHKTQKDSKK
jgi:hypothetical protein